MSLLHSQFYNAFFLQLCPPPPLEYDRYVYFVIRRLTREKITIKLRQNFMSLWKCFAKITFIYANVVGKVLKNNQNWRWHEDIVRNGRGMKLYLNQIDSLWRHKPSFPENFLQRTKWCKQNTTTSVANDTTTRDDKKSFGKFSVFIWAKHVVGVIS